MKTICLGLLLAFCISVNAQKLIVHAGTSVSYIDFEHSTIGGAVRSYKKPLPAFTGSIGFRFFNSKIVSLSSSLGFISKGGKDPGTAFVVPSSVKINYATLNAVAKFTLPSSKKISAFLNTGIYGAAAISSEGLGMYEKKNNRIGMGGILGAGIQLSILKKMIGLEGNFMPLFTRLVALDPYPGIADEGLNIKETADLSFTAFIEF